MQEYIRPKKKTDNVRKQSHVTRDMVLLGDWEKLQDVPAKTINPKLEDETLNGLLIKGYEMKWNKTNENYERYDKTVEIRSRYVFEVAARNYARRESFLYY